MNIDKSLKFVLLACLVLGLSLVIGIFVRISQASPAMPDITLKADADGIEGLKISRDGQGYSLKRSGTSWEIVDPQVPVKANANLVSELTAYLGKMKALRLVSQDSTGLEQLGLASKAITLELLGANNNPIISYKIGNSPNSANELFLQIDNQNTVYALEASLGAIVNRKASDWADQSFWPISVNDQSLVSAFTVTGSQGSEAFTRIESKEGWKGSGSEVASKATGLDIQPLLNQILTLSGTSIEVLSENAVAEKLKSLEKRFSISLASSQIYLAELYQKKGELEGDYTVVFNSDTKRAMNGLPVIITIPSWQVGDLRIRLPEAPQAQ